MLNQQRHQGNLEGCGWNLMMPNNKEAQLNMKPCAILGMYCVNKLSLDVMTWCGVWGRGQRESQKVNTRGAAVAKGSSSELTHKGSLFHKRGFHCYQNTTETSFALTHIFVEWSAQQFILQRLPLSMGIPHWNVPLFDKHQAISIYVTDWIVFD